LAGEIKETKGDSVTVAVPGGERTIKKDLLQELNPPKFEMNEDVSYFWGVQDFCQKAEIKQKKNRLPVQSFLISEETVFRSQNRKVCL
jgi:hypothetical protein